MKKLKGANMDIDFLPSSKIGWKIDCCPWNEKEGTNKHKCAVKNVSICKFFNGIEKLDTVLCTYSKNETNPST